MPLNIEWTNPPDPRPSHKATAELDHAAATIATRPGEWVRLWTGILIVGAVIVAIWRERRRHQKADR